MILRETTTQIDLQLIHGVPEQFVDGRTTLMIAHRMLFIAWPPASWSWTSAASSIAAPATNSSPASTSSA
jgi:hypothetical protein